LPADDTPLRDGGSGARAYAEAVSVYLAFTVDKLSDKSSTIAWWMSTADKMAPTFSRQAIPMVWDYAEMNPFCNVTSNFLANIVWAGKVLEYLPSAVIEGRAEQDDARRVAPSRAVVVSTDPPYYDNIGYADLSDYFYVWLRHSMQDVFPNMFATLLVPKTPELIASPYRFDGDKAAAEAHFES